MGDVLLSINRIRSKDSSRTLNVNRVMKISALLSLAFACTVSASTYGQNYKLSMNKQDCSISEVLKEIEKNSEYTFFLNDNQVNVNRKTSVKANNAS